MLAATYVVDASVVIAWLLPDEPLMGPAAATREAYLTGGTRLLAPDLIYPETGNVLWKAVRRGRISRRTAQESAAALLQMEIPTIPSGSLLEEALTIAIETGRTAYDATYLALAQISGVPLLTADERLANALAPKFPVHWLGMF